MYTIVYIPLDERPCNYAYPTFLANTRSDVRLRIPPIHLLGDKKKPADTEALWKFVFDQAKTADALVLSTDMLLYGGLLPSRLHHLSEDEGLKRIDYFRTLRKVVGNKPIFAFSLIMRTPRYNSADEEPDYYEQYGERIYKQAYLTDKWERSGLSQKEQEELQTIRHEVPKDIIKDYEDRRAFNLNMNVKITELVENGVIDFLAIPQDDSAEYGYTSQDQKRVYDQIVSKRLQSKVAVYPGADEAGSSLVAKAFNHLNKRTMKVYPFFSSTLGANIIPLYEDRPLAESLKSHLFVTDCIWVSNPEEADFILAVNTPGKIMQESSDQLAKDSTYNSFRQLRVFVHTLERYVQEGIPVAVVDSAFANGGDLELIALLDDSRLLDQIISYKAWNTNCNTIGTSIAAAIFGFESTNRHTVNLKKNILYHLLDDGFYQAAIRKSITDTFLPGIGANYFDVKGQEEVVGKKIVTLLKEAYDTNIRHSFKNIVVSNLEITFPWKRMFEIGIHLDIRETH
ncbi:DUF4127 family protein [Shouchella clausii]|uniref:DUF4127 family protein n=1 Tax=Shouchella TaxID=2893057 RepID=UPI000BA4EC4C|nr:DUF4127 family protein [Shouchella clausii]PAD13644.1 hypothetical protein CHH73_20235 [Shouchella clausii]